MQRTFQCHLFIHSNSVNLILLNKCCLVCLGRLYGGQHIFLEMHTIKDIEIST